MVVDPKKQAAPAKRGFWLGLRLPYGMASRALDVIAHDLQDRLSELDLKVEESQGLHFFIEGEELEPSISEQVALADWCLCHTPATLVAISSMLEGANFPLQGSVQAMRIERSDQAAGAVSWLYRMGRIRAEQYVEILGGFSPVNTGRLTP